MVSGLEESSRSLTGVRIGWSGLALLLSFTSAIAIAGIQEPTKFYGVFHYTI